MTEDPKLIRTTVSLGALDHDTFRLGGKRFFRTTICDATGLFLTPSLGGNRKQVARLEELGLSDMLKPPITDAKESDTSVVSKTDFIWGDGEREKITKRICEALNASRANIETFSKDSPNSGMNYVAADQEAWFLINFIWFHREAQDNGSSLDYRLAYAMALGRLIEWWRWRASGLDRMAAGKKRSEAATTKAAHARSGKARNDPPDWHAEARARAAELRKRRGQRSESQIAKIIAEETEMSPRQVARVIAKKV